MSDDMGLNKILGQLENLKNLNLEKVGLVGGNTLLAEVQKLAPVDTGFLRSSGYCEGIPNEGANVVFSADYAFYQEFGSSKFAGNPFVRPAIDSKSDLILTKMKDEVEKQKGDLVK